MINVLINSTTFGQTIGATFDLSIEGALSDKRLTAIENCNVNAPVYERVIDVNKVTSLIASGLTQKVNNLSKAIEVENVRVNSLNMLLRELQFIHETFGAEIPNGVITVYVPGELLQELQSGRVKYYLDDTVESTYYSNTERALWREVLPLVQFYFCNIVFKNISGCKKNMNETQEQADRVSIFNSMYSKLLTAYRELKAVKTGGVTQVTAVNPANSPW